MIYRGLEFIDLCGEKIIIVDKKYTNLIYVNFFNSTILDYNAYYNFFDNIIAIFKNPHYITIKIKSLLATFARENNFIKDDIIKLNKVVYNCICSPYNYSLLLLKKLSHNELAYFLALVIMHYNSIQSYNVSKYVNKVHKEYDQKNNYEETLNRKKYNFLMDYYFKNDPLPKITILIVKMLYNYNYVEIDDKLYSAIEYIKLYPIEKIVKMLKSVYPYLEFIPESVNIQLYYFFLLSIEYHEFYISSDTTCDRYPIYSSYFFFMFFSRLILPQQKDNFNNLNNLITELSFLQPINYYALLNHSNNLHSSRELIIQRIQRINISDEIVHIKEYPSVTEINISDNRLRSYFIQDNNIPSFFLNSDLADNISTLERNKFRFYDILTDLCMTPDSTIEKVLFRFNTSLKNFASRINRIYNSKNIRKENTYWLFTNFNEMKNVSNVNYLTTAAKLALTKGIKYQNYTSEIMLDRWQNSNCEIFLKYFDINDQVIGFSLQDIKNAIVDNILFKIDNDTEFPILALEDLIDLLEESNCSYFTTLLAKLKEVLINKNNLITQGFSITYNLITEDQKILIRKYFYCYFLLLNYASFWIGPGYPMQNNIIIEKNLLLLYREKQMYRIIFLLQNYRNVITGFLGNDWDNNLYLLVDFDTFLPNEYQICNEQGVRQSYNSSKIYQRIQLLSKGFFCMGIFYEQAKYIINAIVVYLGAKDLIDSNNTINNFMQNLTNEILPLIAQDMLNTNLYTKQLINPTEDYNFYKRMSAYYYLLLKQDSKHEQEETSMPRFNLPNDQRQLLAVPLFLLPSAYCKLQLDNIIKVPIDAVKETFKFLKMQVHNNTPFELFNKPYEYYSVIFEYHTLERYLKKGSIQDIGDLSQYSNIYHNTGVEDATNITQYVKYY